MSFTLVALRGMTLLNWQQQLWRMSIGRGEVTGPLLANKPILHDVLHWHGLLLFYRDHCLSLF